MIFRLCRLLYLNAFLNKRRQIGVGHHECRHGDADSDERAELAETGHSAEVQQQKSAASCDCGPEYARRGDLANVPWRQFRMGPRLLIKDNSKIFREAEQNGSKAKTDDVECS